MDDSVCIFERMSLSTVNGSTQPSGHYEVSKQQQSVIKQYAMPKIVPEKYNACLGEQKPSSPLFEILEESTIPSDLADALDNLGRTGSGKQDFHFVVFRNLPVVRDSTSGLARQNFSEALLDDVQQFSCGVDVWSTYLDEFIRSPADCERSAIASMKKYHNQVWLYRLGRIVGFCVSW